MKLPIHTFPDLSTKQLQLKQLSSSDLQKILDLFSNEEVTRYYNIVPLQTLNDATEVLDWFHQNYERGTGIRWGIYFHDSSELLGTIGIGKVQEKHKGVLGYDLFPEFWQQGIMSEALNAVTQFAFETLKLVRLEAEVMPKNIASSTLLLKANFEKDGLLKHWMFWNNNYFDMELYSKCVETTQIP